MYKGAMRYSWLRGMNTGDKNASQQLSLREMDFYASDLYGVDLYSIHINDSWFDYANLSNVLLNYDSYYTSGAHFNHTICPNGEDANINTNGYPCSNKLTTMTPSLTFTPSLTYTPSLTATQTYTPSPTETPTPTATYTESLTPTITPSPTPTETYTPSTTPSPTPTQSHTHTPTLTPTGIAHRLLLHLDAANQASYPGTGTTWYDLSSAQNNATLRNGVSYSSADGGVLTFDGVDDYIQLPTGFADFTQGLTVIAAVKMRSNDGSGRAFERIFDFGNGADNANIWLGRTSGNVMGAEIRTSPVTLATCASCIVPVTNAVYALRIDGSSARFYRNGVLIHTQSYTFTPAVVTRTSNFPREEQLAGSISLWRNAWIQAL
jgi:hypothetical protein